MTLPKFLRILMSGTLIAALALAGCSSPEKRGGYYPGTLTSAFPNYPYPAMAFTATAQTVTLALNGVSYLTLQLTAVALTTVTWTPKVSNDGGTTYVNLACAPYTYSAGALAAIATGAVTNTTAPAYYVCNVAGWTNFEIVTSGTFTATSVTFTPVGTSNKGVL